MKEQHNVDFEIPEVKYEFGQDVKFEVRATNRGKYNALGDRSSVRPSHTRAGEEKQHLS